MRCVPCTLEQITKQTKTFQFFRLRSIPIKMHECAGAQTQKLHHFGYWFCVRKKKRLWHTSIRLITKYKHPIFKNPICWPESQRWGWGRERKRERNPWPDTAEQKKRIMHKNSRLTYFSNDQSPESAVWCSWFWWWLELLTYSSVFFIAITIFDSLLLIYYTYIPIHNALCCRSFNPFLQCSTYSNEMFKYACVQMITKRANDC